MGTCVPSVVRCLALHASIVRHGPSHLARYSRLMGSSFGGSSSTFVFGSNFPDMMLNACECEEEALNAMETRRIRMGSLPLRCLGKQVTLGQDRGVSWHERSSDLRATPEPSCTHPRMPCIADF